MIHQALTTFPILTTERLTLRALSLNDEQGVFALRSDSETNKYLNRNLSKTVEDARNFIGYISEVVEKKESIYWAVTLSESQTFVGTICLFNFLENPKKCEIGYELLSSYQGKGIMQDAAIKVIDYAFQTLSISIIEAFTHQGNQSSTKLLEKLGFKKSIELDYTPADFYLFTLSNQ